MKDLVSEIEASLNKFQGVYCYDSRRDISVSYQELRERVTLASKELQDQDLIAIKLDNRIDFLIYFIAAILSSKDILILNPNETTDNSNKKIRTIGKKHLLIDRNYKSGFINKKQTAILNLNPKVYIGTSATTGVSKIVVQNFENILSNVKSVSKHHFLKHGMTIATALPLYHVNALYFSFLASFLSGSKLVLLDSMNIFMHAEVCSKHKVDILSTIPVLISQYLKHSNKINFSETQIKYFVSAAAPLSVKLLDEFTKKYKIRIVQGYGLSEAINFSCTLPVDIDDSEYDMAMKSEAYPSIGISLDCNDVEILKDDIVATSEFIEGEIILRGKNVFSGYFGERDLNVLHGEWLKTGDLGFYKIINHKKYFYVSGRIKECAKIYSENLALRDVDDCWEKKLLIEEDFFSSSMENSYAGELLVAVVQIENYNDQFLVMSIKSKFEILEISSHRPSLLLFVDKKTNIRTESGKAMRWMFSKYLKKYIELKPSRELRVDFFKD